MIKKIFTHSLLYTLAPQLPRIASLVLLPIITRHLTKYDYGVYGIIVSYLFFANALKDLGFGVVFVNTFFKFPKKWPLIWRLLHGHLIIWSFFYVILLLLLLYIAIPVGEMKNFGWIAFLSIVPSIVFDNTNTIGNYYFRFNQKPLFIAIVTVLTGIVSVFSTYYFIAVLRMGYMGWFYASFISAAVMFLCCFYPVYIKLKLVPIIRFRKKFILPYLKVALPMIPHNYSTYLLNSSDRVVMDRLKLNVGQIGLYNIAYQFGSYFEAFGDAVGMAVTPFYSKLYSANTEKSLQDERKLTFFLMFCFIGLTFLVSLWLKEIFILLIKNKELQSAYSVGILIIMGYAYRPMYWSVGVKLSIFEKTSFLWRITFVAGLINVLLNILFIPRYGIYAAAVTTLFALLYVGFSGYYFKAYKRIKTQEHYPVAWLVAILVLTFFAYLCRDLAYIYKIGITIFILTISGILFFKYYQTLKTVDI